MTSASKTRQPRFLAALLVAALSITIGACSDEPASRVECAGADSTIPEVAVQAPDRDTWEAVRASLEPREAGEPLFPFQIDPAACPEGTWFAYLGLGSAWVSVHRSDDGECQVWLGGETENPRYDGRPTRYCQLPSTCESLSATLPFEDGGPATIDSPYCTSPGVALPTRCDLERAVLSACVTGPGIEEARPFEEPYELSIAGVVEELGVRGEDDCFRSETARVGQWINYQAAQLAQAKWISVRTSGDDLFRVGVITPGFAWDVELGDSVAIDLRTLLFAFAPDRSNLQVRGPAGELIYWLGLDASIEGLTPPGELALEDGGIQCRHSNDCFEERRLHRVRMTADGETKTVDYGDAAEIGALQAVNGGLESQYGGSMCLDAFVAWTAIAAWK